jgi:hypothetical protein
LQLSVIWSSLVKFQCGIELGSTTILGSRINLNTAKSEQRSRLVVQELAVPVKFHLPPMF